MLISVGPISPLSLMPVVWEPYERLPTYNVPPPVKGFDKLLILLMTEILHDLIPTLQYENHRKSGSSAHANIT